jgi:hypothetical protein
MNLTQKSVKMPAGIHSSGSNFTPMVSHEESASSTSKYFGMSGGTKINTDRKFYENNNNNGSTPVKKTPTSGGCGKSSAYV